MSESASAAPAASATFSQPSSATAGLQGYDLARRVKQLFPGAIATKGNRVRAIRRPAGMQKDGVMQVIPQMVSVLLKSVQDIVSANPSDRDELLTKSFQEFETALVPELATAVEAGVEELMTKRAPEAEEPMFKGLGTVGRVANLLSIVANKVQCIVDGKDYESDNSDDTPSDTVAGLLHHVVDVTDLALRAAVNEHVDPVGDDEEHDPDFHYVHIGNVEDPDDEAGMVVKTALPLELAKFATDPAGISMAAVEMGSGLLLEAGVSQDALVKMFDPAPGGELRKDAGVPGAPPDASQQGMAPQPQGFDLMGQLEIAGRIGAAMLMQIDHIMQNVDGTDAGPADGAGPMDVTQQAQGDGAGAPPPDASAQPGPADDGSKPQSSAPGGSSGADDAGEDGVPPKKKPVEKVAGNAEVQRLTKRIEEMEKVAGQPSAELVETRQQLADMEKRLKEVSAQPLPPKGVLRTVSLEKGASIGAEDPALAKMASEIDAARASNDAAKLNQVLLKAAIKLGPSVDLSALRKIG